MNNYYIYVGDDIVGFFEKGKEYYIYNSIEALDEICIKTERGAEYWVKTNFFFSEFKKLETIREEKIKVILDE